MRFTLILLSMLLLGIHISVAQDDRPLPVQIAYLSEDDNGEFVVGGLNLLDGDSVLDISGDYVFVALEFHELAWSPNCEQLMFTAYENIEQVDVDFQNLYMYDLPSGTYTQVIALTGSPTRIIWSPDGSLIAIRLWVGGNIKVVVMNADGSLLRQIYFGANEVPVLEWSPDSKSLIYGISSGSGRQGSVYMVDLTDELLTSVVLSDSDAILALDASSDNTRFSFLQGTYSESGLYVQDFGATEAIELVSPRELSNVSWSPDGEHLAYGFDGHVWSVSPDGASDPVNLTSSRFDDTFNISNPYIWDWTADGEYIVFGAYIIDGYARQYVFAISADGSDYVELLRGTDFSYRMRPKVCILPENGE